MLGYGFALFIIMMLTFQFCFTSAELGFSEDKAVANANNFAVYIKGIESGISDGSLDKNNINESDLLKAIQKYRIGYTKINSWKYISKNGHLYIYAEPSTFPHNSGGSFEMKILDIFENSANVGHKNSNSKLVRTTGNSEVSIDIPTEIPEGSVVYVMTLVDD